MKQLSEWALKRRREMGLPDTATQAEVTAATKALNRSKKEANGVIKKSKAAKNGHSKADGSLLVSQRGEQQAAKSLLQIALMYIGDVSEKNRSENIRAIVMQFLKQQAR
jgi:hypothetical protein